jgi:hypothetical protein
MAKLKAGHGASWKQIVEYVRETVDPHLSEAGVADYVCDEIRGLEGGLLIGSDGRVTWNYGMAIDRIMAALVMHRDARRAMVGMTSAVEASLRARDALTARDAADAARRAKRTSEALLAVKRAARGIARSGRAAKHVVAAETHAWLLLRHDRACARVARRAGCDASNLRKAWKRTKARILADPAVQHAWRRYEAIA